jgi:hypothetical protein
MADVTYPLFQIAAAAVPVKVTKEGSAYVHKEGTDYRCRDCVLFMPDKKRCAIHGVSDLIQPGGYCTYWVQGKPRRGINMLGAPWESVTPKESGYGELKNGTKCARCVFFNGSDDCRRVDKNSVGDDPGKISPQGCCDNQSPRVRA